ncbi:hypothetical protein NTE_02331 [Candidatus Nitrososphaera evergladensis SR1]|uniref:Uncharacterized protein n=1 Tax=Candidatus Nitrososphaera evergladensis SR1 TaxID=1459636 RepID=A0A075MYP4_9ARCH|nr:hypothetical protein [Candidatus Nitrososphaera evergladensis]AIF84384.1 hypothetical protein NTE_02331 [Candidatus Nitrososphaera evergladensis SR1]
MNPQAVLLKCAWEALSTLGEPTMQSIVWHLSNAGVEMVPETFDIRKFYPALADMIGDSGADIIMEIAARSMVLELQLDVPTDPRDPALEKVLKVLEVAQKVAH